MASKDTGFHPSDPEWTRGRAQAVADAESIARRQIGLTRRVTLTETPDPAVNDPECTGCGGTGITYQTERRCACQPAPDAAAPVNETAKTEHDAGNVLTDAAQAREAAARLLLDMLNMRNGAHEGVSKEAAQAMLDAASTREGYAAVDAFLRSIIGEART